MAPDLEVRARECEGTIRRIRDVISARVMLTPDGLVEEVHVLASGGRNPKQLVRDVESALIAQGISVDHKKISVAQLSAEPAEGGSERPKLLGYTVAVSGRSIEARVRLGYRGTPVEGVAAGPGTSSGRMRSLAEATLRAVAQCAGGQLAMFIDDCGISRLGQRTAATVVVTELDGAIERALVGSCLVRQEESEAIVRATLDAVNRRLAMGKADTAG
jgi:hypothetical protein